MVGFARVFFLPGVEAGFNLFYERLCLSIGLAVFFGHVLNHGLCHHTFVFVHGCDQIIEVVEKDLAQEICISVVELEIRLGNYNFL